MESNSLLIRLEELIPKSGEDSIWKLLDDVLDPTFRTEDELEYDAIRETLIDPIIENLNQQFNYFLENINLTNCNLSDIQLQFNAICAKSYESRNDFEIKRDKLLGLNSYNFKCYYNLLKYKELLGILHIRENYKENIKLEIIEEFKNKFIDELSSNKIQIILQKYINDSDDYCMDDGDLLTYLILRADEYFKNRSISIQERDTFGYIEKSQYFGWFIPALNQAVLEFQLITKLQFVESLVIYLKNKLANESDNNFININERANNSSNMNHEAFEYISKVFNNRTQTQILFDESHLITLKTYQHWCRIAVAQMKIEYPFLFEAERLYYNSLEYTIYQC